MTFRRYAIVLGLMLCCNRNAEAEKPQPPAAAAPARDPLAACDKHPQEHATSWTCSNGLYAMEVVAPAILKQTDVDKNLAGYGQTFQAKGFHLDPSPFVVGKTSYPSMRAAGDSEGPMVAQMVIVPVPQKTETHLISCTEKAKTPALCADVVPYLVGKATH